MALILSGTEGVSDVDGSAATPAVRGADTNTGIFFPAADTIAFAEGGAEVARITSTGAWSFGASGTATGTAGQLLVSAGSGASPAWTTVSSSPTLVRSARTSNTILGTADASTLVAITSGTFTQTFTAAATLGSGWFCYIQNLGTGDITLDPNGSETIDGLTSYIMYPGEARIVQCTGTAFFTVVLNSFYRTFTSTDTFVTPPGYELINGWLWGAGGGGGNALANQISGGGGGGACAPFQLRAASLTATVAVTIASGGAGATGNNAAGRGGDSSFGSYITSYGGGGGKGTSDGPATGGTGGGNLGAGLNGVNGASGAVRGGAPFAVEGSVGSVNMGGHYGGGGHNSSASTQNAGSVYGGGCGGGGGQTASGDCIWGGSGGAGGIASESIDNSGISIYGGRGGFGRGTGNGTDGTAPGGGGGATRQGTKGGDGARGELRIWGTL